MKIITLLTDFGLQDSFVGVMKGVIWSIAPDVHIVDLTHAIPPQDILQGALVLDQATPFFPAGSVHIAVVDPGVGTARRPMAAQLGDSFFVGPDNGLCTLLLERAEQAGQTVQAVELNNPRYWLPLVSRTFHGRDIFSPVAAHLTLGIHLDKFGPPLIDPVRLNIPRPQRIANGWVGQVLQIDSFGNLITNLSQSHLDDMRKPQVQVGADVISHISNAFGDATPGSLVALIDSSGCLSVGVVNGSAAARLNAKIGDPVDISSGNMVN